MSYSYKCYSDTKDFMKKFVNAEEGAIIYGIKAAAKTATKTAAAAAGTAVAPGVGTAIGIAAGYAAGVAVEAKDTQVMNRNRKISTAAV